MKLADRLYSETDDTCAICGCRGEGTLTIHHIDHNHDNNVYDNTIVLCHNCHKKHHDTKLIAKEQIVARNRHLMIKVLTQYGLNALKIANRNEFGVVAPPFLLLHLVDLGYMAQMETQMTYGNEVQVDVTARFEITLSGRLILGKYEL